MTEQVDLTVPWPDLRPGDRIVGLVWAHPTDGGLSALVVDRA